MQAPNSTLKTVKNNVEKSLDTPRELGKLNNSVTTLGELEKTLRDTWQKGSYNDFDNLVMTTRNCTKEDAEQLREKWLDEGLVAYDPEGRLIWVR